MPKQKTSNKKTTQYLSNPLNKLFPFNNNNISDIISKFEKSQKSRMPSNPAIVPISHCARLKNSTMNNNNNQIYGNSQNRDFSKSFKQSSLAVNKYKMCESIDGGVINGDLCDNNNHNETTIENNEQFDGSESFEDTDNDPNDFEFIPIQGDGIKSQTPSKFMRLKNINLVRYQLNFFQRFVGILLSFPFFSSINGAGLSTLACAFFLPRILCENILYPIFRLILGTLYPAYASYKAVRNKDVKDYLKWIMYWIVFAFFTCCETFTDIFLSWFPFYYELKVVIVIWLLSPVTEGSSVLYRNFVHPMLTKREKEIDEYINQAKEKGCSAVIQLGSKGVNYATNVIMQTALKGGGNLVSTLRKSYSLSDLSEPDMHRGQDEVDEIIYGRSNQVIQYRQMPPSTQRYIKTRMQNQNMIHSNGMNRSSSTNRTVDVYYDDGMSRSSDNYDYIRSSEDISSGYSSTEANSMALNRTTSLSNGARYRPKTRRNESRRSNDRIVEVDDAVAVTNHTNDLDIKYELFCKWLNANEANQINSFRSNQKPIIDHQTCSLQNMLLTEDEVSSFATNESDSGSDIFLDTENEYPSIILSEIDENTAFNGNLNVAKLTEDAIHGLRADTPSQLSVSDFDCSSSDVTVNSRGCLTPDRQKKRKAKHKKGPAPPIPSSAQNSNEIDMSIIVTTEHTKSHIETDI